MKSRKRPKVSLVVPIFNVEKYLQECLERVVNQTLDEIQIILVNDGSTDQSGYIAEQFAKNDSRITLIDQPNKGLSVARNVGVNHAIGDYVAFVDSDDFPFLNYCEDLYRYALQSNADGVIARFGNYVENGNRISLSPLINSMPKPGVEVISPMYFGKVSMATYAKIWKRKLLIENQLTFPEGLFMQDRHFNLKALYFSDEVAFLNKEIYRRNVNPSSTMNTVRKKHVLDCYEVLAADRNFLHDQNCFKKYGFGIYFASFKVLFFIYQQLGHKLFSDADLLETYSLKLQQIEFPNTLPFYQRHYLNLLRISLQRDLNAKRNKPFNFKVALSIGIKAVKWIR